MILDKKGKLFGKISIVDVLVVVIIIAIACGLYYKYNRSGTVTPFTATQKIQLSLYMESVNNYMINSIKVGDVVRDRVQNVVLGKVTDLQIAPDIIYYGNDMGMAVRSSKEGYSSVTLVFEGEGIYKETGVFFNGIEYYINKNGTEWRIGNTFCYARISDIKLLKE